MGRALSSEERQRILVMITDGVSCNEIARQVGRAAGTVSKAARQAGLSFDRAVDVEAANRANQADGATRRASMIKRLYGQAESVMDRLEAPLFQAVGFDFGKALVTTVAREAAPAADVRSLSATVVNLMQAAARLEAVDASKNGSDAGHSAMDAFVDAVRRTYDAEGLERDSDPSA